MSFLTIFRILVPILLAWIVSAFSASQVSAQLNNPLTRSTEINLTERANWSPFLQSSEQALARDGIDDVGFDHMLRDAGQVESSARKLIESQTPILDQLNVQIDELGPAPKEGDAEAPEIAEQRKELNDRFAQVDGTIKDARLAIVRSQQLRASIVQKRRDRFISSILTRVKGVYTTDFLGKFIGGFEGLGRSFQLMLKDSFSVFVIRINERPATLFLMLAALILVALLYSFAVRQTSRLHNLTDRAGLEADSAKSVRAAIKFINFGLLNAFALYLVFYIFNAFDLLTAKLERFSWLALLGLIMIILGRSLGKIYLSPDNPQTRVSDLSDGAATRIYSVCRVALLLGVILYILNDTAIMLVAPFEVSIGLSVLLTIVVVATTFWTLLSISRDRYDHKVVAVPNAGFLSWVYLKPLLWAAILLAFVALLLGYIAFSEYLSLQILAGLILLGMLWLALKLIDAVKQALLSNESHTYRLAQSIGMQPGRLKQFSVLGFGLLKTVVMLLVAVAMLLPWGFRTSEWVDWVNEAFFGFKIGGLTISLSTIFMVIALFLIGYGITRGVQNWLSNQFLPTTRIDTGLRNSISTILGYVGIVIAAMLAVSAAGVDLSNFAIVAGALSVGVGFGLQSIVNNFVSGLILLAERPIKSGDWIITSGGEGTVRKISVRSTEIETFERATIIVPNSTLITESVTNWTHTSKFGRINIVIGVGYDSDPEQVRDILLDCFNAHEDILRNPEPSAFFTDFGADALIFDARGFLSNIDYGFSTKSDLRFAIFKALREANIEIPYPQRDFHLKADWREVGESLGLRHLETSSGRSRQRPKK